MPRIVIFRSNPIDPDPRVEKIAFALSKRYQVQVVGWDRTGTLATKRDFPRFSLELFSHAAPFGTGRKNLFHLLFWQVFLFKWVLRHARNYEVIHACDFDTVLPALFGKIFFGCKVVYDIFDFYADHVRNTPNWLRRLIRWLDYQAIRGADALILVTEAQLVQIKGAKPARQVFIYNTPIDRQGSVSPARDPSVILRIAYIGMLQRERGFDDIFAVMSRHPNWHLDLAGYGGDEQNILSQALKLTNVSWHGRVPYEKTLSLSEQADVLFSICDPAIYHYASPNKVFEAMMLKKPVIVARDTYMDKIVEENQCGLVIHYGNVSEIESAFLTLEKNPQLKHELGENGRKAYEKFFTWDLMEERLLGLYAELR